MLLTHALAEADSPQASIQKSSWPGQLTSSSSMTPNLRVEVLPAGAPAINLSPPGHSNSDARGKRKGAEFSPISFLRIEGPLAP